MNFPDEEFSAVRDAVRTLKREAIAAGAWIFGGGFGDYSPRAVGVDSSIKEGPLQESQVHLGGFTVIEVATDVEALDWAKKIAVACRCAQEVRKFIDDSNQE